LLVVSTGFFVRYLYFYSLAATICFLVCVFVIVQVVCVHFYTD